MRGILFKNNEGKNVSSGTMQKLYWSYKEIAADARLLYPHKKAFTFVSNAIKKVHDEGEQCFEKSSHFYALDADYGYIDPVYFNAYEDLKNEILDSAEKWIVFVDNEK